MFNDILLPVVKHVIFTLQCWLAVCTCISAWRAHWRLELQVVN